MRLRSGVMSPSGGEILKKYVNIEKGKIV